MPTSQTTPKTSAKLASRVYRKASGQDGPDWSLIERYLPLVKAIVSRMRIYFPPNAELDDLYSVGVSGLITAIRRCDPDKSESFGAYAALRIRGAILDELRKLDLMPRGDRLQAKRLRVVVTELEQKLQRPASEDEIAEAMGISRQQYMALLDQIRPISFISLDSSATSDSPGSEGNAVHEVVSDDTLPDARDRAEKHEMVALLRERIKVLPDIPRKVLMMYYYEGMRLAEIATVFGLTESRICQIHAQAVISLRTYLDRASKG